VGIPGDEYWEARALELRRALGERIRYLRERSGESQETFAERAGIHRTHVGMIENARIEPRLSTLLKLAHTLGLEVHELLRQASRNVD
jgi:transcriptional regulator with XRE-family HTH domain